jgi:hypothetical protein
MILNNQTFQFKVEKYNMRRDLREEHEDDQYQEGRREDNFSAEIKNKSIRDMAVVQ